MLETTFRLGVHVAFSANKAEEDGKKNEGMGRGPKNESNPDAEVVDFKDL